MKSNEIEPGDVLLAPEDGEVVYTVEEVEVHPPHVVAVVRYVDGGRAQRMWESGKDTPITRQ
jgi:hypothetical protein